MWIEERNGRYVYQERYTDPLTKKVRKVSVTLTKKDRATERIARRVLDQKIEEAISRTEVYVMEMTLADLVEKYREYQQKAVAKSTYTRNYHAENTMLKLLGKDVLLSKLTAGYIRECFASDGAEPTTINERYARFKAMMRWAYQNDYIESIMFLEKLKHLKDVKKKQKLEDKFLEKEELTTLLASMTHKQWHDLAELISLSGLRLGEAIALTTNDIDLTDRIIHVTKTRDVANGITTAPKTADSVREVFMQPELYRFCIGLKKRVTERNMAHGNKTNLIFINKDDDYINYFAFNKYLKIVSQRVIGKPITSHTLRHTHASLLAEQGLDLETISRRLGHSDSRITKQVYLHVTQGLKEKDNYALSKVTLLG